MSLDEEGIELFAVHYNINEPLPGVEPGEHNYDITEPTGRNILRKKSHNNTMTLGIIAGIHLFHFEYTGHLTLEINFLNVLLKSKFCAFVFAFTND